MTQLMRRSEIESVKCVGCEFVHMFSPHDGGYCQVHGDIPAMKAAKEKGEKDE